MFTTFKKIFSLNNSEDSLVLEIHKSIDELEEKTLNEYKVLLKNDDAPNENKLNKVKMLRDLGFSESNVTINDVEKNKIKDAELKLINYKRNRLVELINDYKEYYPNDKIIPMSEFEELINSYKLVYAPAKYYINEVPEKNLIEITKSRKTSSYHVADRKIVITRTLSQNEKYDSTKELQLKLKKICLEYANDVKLAYSYSTYAYGKDLNSIYKNKYGEDIIKTDLTRFKDIRFLKDEIYLDDLMISAPKTHFDSEKMDDAEKIYYGFGRIKNTVIKDPIAFYILKGIDNNDIVRIVSKWGTSDDQSYLDVRVQKEIDN